MRPENQKMQAFLKSRGIDATPKYISEGSMRGVWRLYKKNATFTKEIESKLTEIGFTNYDGSPLDRYIGNGGIFQVFVKASSEIIKAALA